MRINYYILRCDLTDDDECERWESFRDRLPESLVDCDHVGLEVPDDTHLLAPIASDLERAGISAADVSSITLSANGVDFHYHYACLPHLVLPDGSLAWHVAYQSPEVTVGAVARTAGRGLLDGGTHTIVVEAFPQSFESGEFWWDDLLSQLEVFRDLGGLAATVRLVWDLVGLLKKKIPAWTAAGASADDIAHTVMMRKYWSATEIGELFKLDALDTVKLLECLGYEQQPSGLYARLEEADLAPDRQRLREILRGLWSPEDQPSRPTPEPEP
jgi:hypothetical protein